MMLTFHLKKVWYDKIKAGEKTHEYREVKPYWNKRIEIKRKNIVLMFGGFPFCEFVCGYANKDDKDKRLKAKIKSITIKNGKNTDLKIDKDVFDIEFEVIK